jgi:hypothetical protein
LMGPGAMSWYRRVYKQPLGTYFGYVKGSCQWLIDRSLPCFPVPQLESYSGARRAGKRTPSSPNGKEYNVLCGGARPHNIIMGDAAPGTTEINIEIRSFLSAFLLNAVAGGE